MSKTEEYLQTAKSNLDWIIAKIQQDDYLQTWELEKTCSEIEANLYNAKLHWVVGG